MADIHVARTGPAFDGTSGTAAIQGDLSSLLKREDPLILQEHHAFRSQLPYFRNVFFFKFLYLRCCDPHLHPFSPFIRICHLSFSSVGVHESASG